MNTIALCAGATTVIVACGCTTNHFADDYWPAPGPLGSQYDAVRVPREPAQQPDHETPHPTGVITLPESLALALQHSPHLAGYAWEIRAREARMIQAHLWPNPELQFEIEDFGGTGPASDFRGSETTLAIGQTLLLADKASRRVDVARYERDLAGWDYEAARVTVFTRTAADFTNVLTAQHRVELATETAELAGRIYNSIGERVEAGKISPVEQTKANVELAQAGLALKQAQAQLVSARHQLAAHWGAAEPTFDAVAGDIDRVVPPPTYDSVIQRVEHNPELARWSSEMAMRRAAIELALAEAVPDLTIRGGVRFIEGGDDTALVVGASMPIPIFDRNQGAILAARIRNAQSGALRRAAAVRVRSDLAIAVQRLNAAYDEVITLRDDVLPSSQSAFAAAEEAFRQGKIGALDLLDAERTLFAARSQYTSALGRYHRSVIHIERLIGAPLNQTSDDHRAQGEQP